MQNIQVILFKNAIEQYQVPLLRGAIINCAGINNHTLLHNHTDDGFRFRYPLVQYKRIDGKAAMVCINEGCLELTDILKAEALSLNLGHKLMTMRVNKICFDEANIECSNEMRSYNIYDWLPLNSKNYNIYKSIASIAEKCCFLEKILTGNILSMMKGLNVFAKEEVVCSIQNVHDIKTMTSKGVKMLSFDLRFACNVNLPEFIGIGKHSSLGFGTIRF